MSGGGEVAVSSQRGGALERAADDVLADRAADGDTRAFAVIVRRHGRLLRAYAARLLGSSAQSDDVVQEALVTAWQQLDSLEDRTALRAWLMRITNRKAMDVLRSTRPHADVDGLEVAAPGRDEPEQRVRAASLDEALARSLGTLPVQQRQAWVMRELGGASYDAIAADLGVPLSTVRGLLARARTRLIHDMDDWR